MDRHHRRRFSRIKSLSGGTPRQVAWWQQPPLRLDKVSGIQNQILIFIGKIACLDSWKRTSQSNGTLSIIELVKRATRLETELRQALDEFSKEQETSTAQDRPPFPYLKPLAVYSDYVTEFYGRSALIYLHVIVSGPCPELPEIRENFALSMDLLRRLPTPLLPRSMWWAVLITGSLALEGDEQTLVRNIIAGAGVNESSVGFGYNVLKVLEECWRRRRLNEPIPHIRDGY
jgi:hypothetical protein